MARGLARVVERDAFKTVFVLRLSPILPLPLGAYNYIYGVANVSAAAFIPATFLGSLKPYLLDSYLGVFSKSLIDGESFDAQKVRRTGGKWGRAVHAEGTNVLREEGGRG